MSTHTSFDHVALLTDYGLDDEFVGVMKSVITDIAPHARITDIGHNVRAYDVRAGSLMLARAIQYVPRGVVVAVVDPGVATKRRMVALEVAAGEGVLIGPDNGLLVPAAALVGGVERAVVLSNAELHLPAPGATFAGRDIFAPVAAHLCNGVAFDALGDIVDPDILMPGLVGLPQVGDNVILAEVTWVDVYGNCQLNVGPEDVATLAGALRRLNVVVGGVERSAALVTAFDDISDGALGLVVDSYGMLALAKRQDSAARDVGLASGDQVELRAAQSGENGTTTRVSLGRTAPDGTRH